MKKIIVILIMFFVSPYNGFTQNTKKQNTTQTKKKQVTVKKSRLAPIAIVNKKPYTFEQSMNTLEKNKQDALNAKWTIDSVFKIRGIDTLIAQQHPEYLQESIDNPYDFVRRGSRPGVAFWRKGEVRMSGKKVSDGTLDYSLTRESFENKLEKKIGQEPVDWYSPRQALPLLVEAYPGQLNSFPWMSLFCQNPFIWIHFEKLFSIPEKQDSVLVFPVAGLIIQPRKDTIVRVDSVKKVLEKIPDYAPMPAPREKGWGPECNCPPPPQPEFCNPCLVYWKCCDCLSLQDPCVEKPCDDCEDNPCDVCPDENDSSLEGVSDEESSDDDSDYE